MLKSTRYKKVDRYCDICTCDPCDCDGAWDEFRIMGTDRTTPAREEPILASWQDRIASFSLVQVEGRIIEPKNRVLLSGMQGDLPTEEGTDRENHPRGSAIDGD